MSLRFKSVLELTLISLVFTSSSIVTSNSQLNFTLKNSNFSDVEIIKEAQFYIKTNRLVELECIADFPIKITVLGIRFNWIEYTEREVIKNKSPNNYYYQTSIGFKSNPEATGQYTCSYSNPNASDASSKSPGSGNNSQNLISSLYIFAHDGKKREIILSNKYIQDKITTLTTDTEVLIPCITPNPHFKPSLYKNNVNYFSQSNIVPNSTYTFDPSQGFFLNVKKYNYNLVSTFNCRVDEDIESQVAYSVEIPDYKVNIEESEIYVTLGETVFVKCESIHPTKIYFHYTLQNRRSSQLREEGKVSQNGSSYYKYIAILNATVVDKNFLKGFVQCMQVQGSTPYKNAYHQWNISIGTPKPSVAVHSFEDALGFRKDKNLFYCSVRKDFTSTMTSIDCQNLVNCETVKRFHPHTYSSALPFNVSRGFLAERYLKKELNLDQDNECAIISPPHNSSRGIIQCLIVQNMLPQGPDEIMMSKPVVVTMQYYTDLKNIADRTDNIEPQPADVLQFKDLNETVYFDQTINVTCEASTALFAKGMELKMTLNKNTKKMQKDTKAIAFDLLHSSDNYKITVKQTVYIWSMDIVSIECRAYNWDAHTWKSISKKIQVKASQKPKFVDLENLNSTNATAKNRHEIELKLHDKNKNITCSATGIPLPTIQWRRHDDLAPIEETSKVERGMTNVRTFLLNESTIMSTLTFKKITNSHQCEYICIAENIVGQENQTFHVIVKSEGFPMWILYTIGGVSLGILVVFLLVVIILCRTLQSQQNKIEKLSEVEIHHFINGNQDLVQRYEELNDVAQYLPYKQQYEIHPSKIDFKNDVLGSGDFGMVLRGVLEKSGKKFPVAVKTVKSGTDIRHLKSLLSEIKIMMYIGKHPHIIELLGAITKELKDGKLYVIVEFCSNGSLQSYLRSCRPIFLNQIVDDEIIINPPPIPKSPRSRFLGDAITTAIEKRRSRSSNTVPIIKTIHLITWCYEVATGMEFLASKKVVHGDLATRNLLITENLSVKITDFGLSRHLYAYTDYVKKQQTEPLPWRWLSIEGIQDSKFSTESDVWAYGVTLWEIFSLAETPYQGFCWGEEFVQDLCKGYRMGKPKFANNELHNTMLECWNTAPKDRPTFTDIANNFKEMLQRINSSAQQNMEGNVAVLPATPSKQTLLQVPVEV